MEYYIAKLEHSEFYSDASFIKMIGFQSDKAKVYKSCKFLIDYSNKSLVLSMPMYTLIINQNIGLINF